MAENPSFSSPPAYGAVVTNQPNIAPPQADGTSSVAAVQPGYPQPGEMSGTPYPNEPPPKYEPPKDQSQMQYPPTGYPPSGYQGPPSGYQTGYPASQTVVVTHEMSWSPHPKTLQCPRCQAYVTSGTIYRPGGLTWLASGLICLFGCWAGCCLVPFCVPDLQDVEHVCPNCNYTLGIYHRM